MKPIVAVDLDEVVYEWDRTARYLLRNYRGVPGLRDMSQDWDWTKRDLLPQDRDWLWSEGVRRGLFRYGHMVTGARRGLEDLVDIGYKLKIVSHRPANAINDTLDWVSLYFKDIPLDGIHLLTQGENKAEVKGDYLVDDKPENIRDWIDAERTGIIFTRNWNKDWNKACHIECYARDDGTSHLYRANGWDEVVSTLADLQLKGR